jgi:hypothetical protein
MLFVCLSHFCLAEYLCVSESAREMCESHKRHVRIAMFVTFREVVFIPCSSHSCRRVGVLVVSVYLRHMVCMASLMY